MKTILTPLLYSLAIWPLTGISVGMEMLIRRTGLIGEYAGIMDLPLVILYTLSILLFGIPLFYYINIGIQKWINTNRGRPMDHFSTCFLLYLVTVLIAVKWMVGGFVNNEENGYLLVWMGISIVGILVNVVFLKIGKN